MHCSRLGEPSSTGTGNRAPLFPVGAANRAIRPVLWRNPGSQASAPIERIADTAIAAEAEFMALHRLCGRYGKVEIWTENRLMSPLKLQALALRERASA